MKPLTTVCFLLISIFSINQANGLAVMSVDLGTEWMKVGIVSPGVPMEIALNKESKRKSPAVMSFRDNIRTFGEDAQTVGIRFPKNAYIYLLDLLGKGIDHPLVKLYQQRFPYYEIVENKERGTIMFKHDDDTFYTPEELLAQYLVKAKEFAEQGANQPIKECVLTVPGYFNQVERKALLQAAQLANLKVLQLINDYAAVALNYGIFRTKDFNDTAQYVMFYDMGASSTTATIVSYQNTKTKERGFVETHPTINIIGVGYDRTLGGLEIQIRLRDYLAKKFNKLKKTKNDVTKNPRAMAKLFKEAGRLKNVLSANADHYAQIEGLLDEQDFKVQVTRDDLEELIADLLERVGGPVDQALKTAHLSQDIISQVVLFGAGTRVPKIQEVLQKKVGQALAKNINTDEAAAMGAVYKAADLSTGFQVKKFIVKDAVTFPIQVVFDRESDGKSRTVKRTLFGLMNPYPQKKIITFNKHTTDFSFNVNYGDLEHLPEAEIVNLGSLNLTEIQVTGVEEAFKKNSGDNIETKGIKAHFQMDDSGLLNLLSVELQVEKTVTADDEQGTFSKLGSTISKLFGSDDKPVEEKVDEKPEEKENESSGSGEDKTEEKKESSSNGTTSEKVKLNETTSAQNVTETKEKKAKIVLLKEPIKSEVKPLTIAMLSQKQLEESQEKIQKLDNVEKEINRRAAAMNNLESFVNELQNKLYEDDFAAAATDEQKETIPKLCQTVSDWLYEDGSEADAETYEKKLKELKDQTMDIFMRVWEHKERPDALKALNNMLNHSDHFLLGAKNFTNNPDQDVFTEVEVTSLEKMIQETKDWRDKQVEAQEKLKQFEPIKLTKKAIGEKMAVLDREINYLLNKMKRWVPKKADKKEKKEEKVVKENEQTETKETDEINAEETQEEATQEEQETITPSTSETSDKKHSEL